METKNRLFSTIMVIISFEVLISVLGILNEFGVIDIQQKLIGGLKLNAFLSYVLLTLYLAFLVFIKKAVRWYTLPVISLIFISQAQVLVESDFPMIIYSIIVSYPLAFILIYEGVKKRNSIAFGLGIYIFAYSISILTLNIYLVLYFRGFASFLFLLGVKDFYTKYIFPEKDIEEKIKSTWISKFV
ncbi:MAG: hypothetical protein ACTSSM_09620, partial [Promethearchaeota archaeon]